jgi:(p)ppGpp synthase/HD superfamily hydrolase
VAQQGAYIAAVDARSNRSGHTTLGLSLECTDADHVVRVLDALSRHPAVLELRRVTA